MYSFLNQNQSNRQECKRDIKINGNKIMIENTANRGYSLLPGIMTSYYDGEEIDKSGWSSSLPLEWLKTKYNYRTDARVEKVYKIDDKWAGMIFFVMSDNTTILMTCGSGIPWTGAEFGKFADCRME